MTKKRDIAVRLREKILGGVSSGALRAGDRLPSSRALAPEFEADPRVIAAAYRILSMEALVEIKPRSGIYVSRIACEEAMAQPVPLNWLADVFVNAVTKGLPISELGSVVFDFAETRRIRAAVVANTTDQAVGISAELKREYGLNASPYHLDEIAGPRRPAKFMTAAVVFAANDCATQVREVTRALRRTMIAISLRPDVLDAEWLRLAKGRVYVVATDPAFAMKIPGIFPPALPALDVSVLLVGRDDLSVIPPEAPTYVTESARRAIGKTELPGRVIRPRRLFSDATVRNVVSFIMAHNCTYR